MNSLLIVLVLISMILLQVIRSKVMVRDVASILKCIMHKVCCIKREIISSIFVKLKQTVLWSVTLITAILTSRLFWMRLLEVNTPDVWLLTLTIVQSISVESTWRFWELNWSWVLCIDFLFDPIDHAIFIKNFHTWYQFSYKDFPSLSIPAHALNPKSLKL